MVMYNWSRRYFQLGPIRFKFGIVLTDWIVGGKYNWMANAITLHIGPLTLMIWRDR